MIKRVSLNVKNWFSFWTLLEIVMYSMFATSVILRFTLSAENFYHARMAYAITLGIFIINSMQFFLVSKHIGPKVIMIGRMVSDLNILSNYKENQVCTLILFVGSFWLKKKKNLRLTFNHKNLNVIYFFN